jgi:hypothetical protein
MSRFLLPLFLSITAMQTLLAVERIHVRDVRITVGSTPETDDVDRTWSFQGDSYNVTPSGSSLKESPRFGLAMTESFGDVKNSGGFALSLGYAHSEQKSDKGFVEFVSFNGVDGWRTQGTQKQTVNVFDLGLVYVLAMSDHVHAEFGVFAGLGTAQTSQRMENSDGGVTRFNSPSQTYYEYGPKVGIFYTFESQLQLGLEGGWLMSHAETTIVYDVASTTAQLVQENEIDQSGPFGTLTLGIRF